MPWTGAHPTSAQKQVPVTLTRLVGLIHLFSTHFDRFPHKKGCLSYYTWLISSGLEEIKNLCWCWVSGKWTNFTPTPPWSQAGGFTSGFNPSSLLLHPLTKCQSTHSKVQVQSCNILLWMCLGHTWNRHVFMSAAPHLPTEKHLQPQSLLSSPGLSLE